MSQVQPGFPGHSPVACFFRYAHRALRLARRGVERSVRKQEPCQAQLRSGALPRRWKHRGHVRACQSLCPRRNAILLAFQGFQPLRKSLYTRLREKVPVETRKHLGASADTFEIALTKYLQSLSFQRCSLAQFLHRVSGRCSGSSVLTVSDLPQDRVDPDNRARVLPGLCQPLSDCGCFFRENVLPELHTGQFFRGCQQDRANSALELLIRWKVRTRLKLCLRRSLLDRRPPLRWRGKTESA